MFMLGSLVNAVAIVLAALLGTCLRRGIPERIGNAMLTGAAIAVMFVGISGAMDGYHTFSGADTPLAGYGMVIVVLSLALGGLIGELIDIDAALNRLGAWVEHRLTKERAVEKANTPSLAVGFVNCTILFCVGSMSILGAIEDVGTGVPNILFSKAVIDAIAALVMASTMGIGCALSAIPVLLYQGLFSLLALLFLSGLPVAVMGALSMVGSLIIVVIGLNMLGITKIKTANFIPAVFLPLLLLFFL